jgi:hypothetical protein
MEDLPRLLQPRLRVGGSARGQGAAARAGQRLCFIQGTADLAGQVQGLPVTSLGRVSGSRAPAAGSSAGLVMLATLSARVVACRGRGQADDGLPGLRAELEDGAELGAADAGVAHQGQELDLFFQQPGLFVVVVEEEGRRHAERLGQCLDQPFLRVLGLAV